MNAYSPQHDALPTSSRRYALALRTVLALSFLVLPACSPTSSSTAATIDNEATNILAAYEQLRTTPVFQNSVSSLRDRSMADIHASIPDNLQIGGRSFKNVRTVLGRARALQGSAQVASAGSVKELLVKGNLLSDRLSQNDARELLAIVSDVLKSGGNEVSLREALGAYSSDQVLKAINTAVIYDALQASRSKKLSLAEFDAPTLKVSADGACFSPLVAAGSACIVQNLTGIATDIWSTKTKVSAGQAARANVAARQVSVQAWNEANTLEASCKLAAPPADQCSYRADATPPGPSPEQNGPDKCKYKVWACACSGASDSAQRTCTWVPAPGSGSATAGMINPLGP